MPAEAPEVRTTCPYCGVGCGVIAYRTADGTPAVRGDEAHPANFGRLCSKGSALAETLALDDRLLYPEIDGTRVDWARALDAVAEGFRHTIAEHGPDAVALYVSGQLLTEDYYVANKLMKGCIGSANIDTNSRLCMSSSVAGHKRAFGTDTVPGTYEDLEQADLLVLVGSNLAWCHPVLYQRILAARKARGGKPKMIVAGFSAYSQVLDFPRFRAIADRVGAYLFVDMAHVAGLVAAGLSGFSTRLAAQTQEEIVFAATLPLTGPFAAVAKVYSSKSQRRVQSDLADSAEKGNLGHVAHFNTISNFLGDESSTALLVSLIEESAKPLAALDWRTRLKDPDAMAKISRERVIAAFDRLCTDKHLLPTQGNSEIPSPEAGII